LLSLRASFGRAPREGGAGVGAGEAAICGSAGSACASWKRTPALPSACSRSAPPNGRLVRLRQEQEYLASRLLMLRRYGDPVQPRPAQAAGCPTSWPGGLERARRRTLPVGSWCARACRRPARSSSSPTAICSTSLRVHGAVGYASASLFYGEPSRSRARLAPRWTSSGPDRAAPLCSTSALLPLVW